MPLPFELIVEAGRIQCWYYYKLRVVMDQDRLGISGCSIASSIGCL